MLKFEMQSPFKDEKLYIIIKKKLQCSKSLIYYKIPGLKKAQFKLISYTSPVYI